MIRRTFAALEDAADREILTGIDRSGQVSWHCSARDLLGAVGSWQAFLHSRGVVAGDRVGIDLPRGPELVPAHLAVLGSGATVVPINPSLARPERERLLARAELRTLITGNDRPQRRGPLRLADRDPTTPASLIFTSGTTGEPKGVPLSEANLESNLEALTQIWGLNTGDRLLHVLPAHHVHGLVLALYGSLRLALPVLLMEHFDADRCVEVLSEQEVSVFMGVPTMFRRMTRSSSPHDLSCMRVFISGSAPLPEQDFDEFAARFGQLPIERYGLSETMIVASNPLDAERRAGTVGRPLPKTELRLAADGEIEVRGPAVMHGYWRAPEISSECFADGFFKTGDIGRYDAAGYLCIAGRKKELIIVGGSNVFPGEVEQALAPEPGLEELAAVGQPDADRGEVVAVFVVPTPGTDPGPLEERLRERAKATLAAYKQPRVYHFKSALPRNSMGKLDRRLLLTS